MTFPDPVPVAVLSLTDRVSLLADNGTEWVTGKVVELSLLGDGEDTARIGLKSADGVVRWFDRSLATEVIWDHAQDLRDALSPDTTEETP